MSKLKWALLSLLLLLVTGCGCTVVTGGSEAATPTPFTPTPPTFVEATRAQTPTSGPPTSTPRPPTSKPPTEPSITVISPNGGEEWFEGHSYDIVWTSSGVEKVDIAVAAGGKDLGHIALGLDAACGRYAWEIPPGRISGFGVSRSDRMKIRISDSRDPGVYDENDDYFSISGE